MKKILFFILIELINFNALCYSLVERGASVGIPLGSVQKPDLEYQNVNTYISEPGNLNHHSVNIMSNIPVFTYHSKNRVLGGQVILHLVPPSLVFEKGKGQPFKQLNEFNKKWEGGSFNPFGLAGIAWDLPLGWGFSNSVGGFIPWQGSNYSYHGWVFIDAIGLGHYKPRDHNFTGIVFIGVPGVYTSIHQKADNNFFNFNLTASKTFKEKYEIGGLMYHTRDFGKQAGELFPMQSQLAFGGLIGYYQENWYIQAWYGHDVSQKNYHALCSAGFIRLKYILIDL